MLEGLVGVVGLPIVAEALGSEEQAELSRQSVQGGRSGKVFAIPIDST